MEGVELYKDLGSTLAFIGALIWAVKYMAKQNEQKDTRLLAALEKGSANEIALAAALDKLADEIAALKDRQ